MVGRHFFISLCYGCGLLLSAGLPGCNGRPPELQRSGLLPGLDSLEVLAILKPRGSFVPSGVAGLPDCSILLAGRSWGTLAKIGPDGNPGEASGRIPGHRGFASLERGPDGSVLAWAAEPAFLARVNPDMTLDSIAVPLHPWGGRWIGPAVPVSSSAVAVAPIANRQEWVESPDPWVDAPLVLVLDGKGRINATAGLVVRQEGRYLTWLMNRAVLGSRGDTIMALLLSSGSVRKYVPSDDLSRYDTAFELELGTYFVPPAPVEEVHSRPWITDGGDVFVHVHVPQVETGSFGGERIYAVRNYNAKWAEVKRETSFRTHGRWAVISRGLEIYDLAGSRLAALTVPASGPVWIRADGNGRMFLGSGDSVIVARDPTMEGEGCPIMPSRVLLPFADLPL